MGKRVTRRKLLHLASQGLNADIDAATIERVKSHVIDALGCAAFEDDPVRVCRIERKFRGNVGARWAKRQTDDVLQTLWTLEMADDISALLRRLVI